jgi:RNA polymerase sigma factor (sigma-70 family)
MHDFWAYASWWVRQAMQQLVSELSRSVVLSDRALRQLAQLKEGHAELQRAGGRAPTLRGAGRAHRRGGGSVGESDRRRPAPKALEEPLEGEEGTVGTVGELIADPLAEDEYEHVISYVTVSELRDLLRGLSERERAVLRGHFGLDAHTQSLREIAGRLGVSAERVRQFENRALGKLRAAATGESNPD